MSGPKDITIGDRFAQGDLCDLYFGATNDLKPSTHEIKTALERVFEDDEDVRVVVKTARFINDNDLVANEAHILTHLYPSGAKEEKFYRYLPRLLHSYVREDGRRTNVIPYFPDFVSFADILRVYPDGIDYRDLAWMFKRLLACIGFAHTKGVVHGAVLPPHVLVHPTGHGAKIIDWSYAVVKEDRNSIKAVCTDWRTYYPPEVFQRQLPTAATDVYMAAQCAVALLGGDVKVWQTPGAVPVELCEFLAPCLKERPSERPQDAWALHEAFDRLLLKLVGKPAYRPFTMPEGTSSNAT